MTPPTPNQQSAQTVAERDHLDRSLGRGIAWTGLARWGSQLVMWVSTILVARQLHMSDYGLVGMAMIYHGFVTLINSLGFGMTIVTLRELDSRQISEINALAVGVGVAFLSISFAAAPILAWIFGAPELYNVVVVLSFAHVISSLRSVPTGLLQRSLRFRCLAGIESVKSIAQAVATIVMAYSGLGYWSLILGPLVGETVWTGLTLCYERTSFGIPRIRSIGTALRFSGEVLASQIAWYSYSNSDFFVAGKLLGRQALGAYSLAWSLASLPIQKITNVVKSVTASTLSAVQDKDEELTRYALGLTEGLALLAFPAGVGMGLVADRLIPLALTEKWDAAIAPIRILSVFATIQAIFPIVPQILVVKRNTGFLMRMNVLMAIVLPLGFVFGAGWGTVGIALGWLLLYPLLLIPYYVKTFSLIGLSAARYFGAIWPSMSSTMVMGLAVLALKSFDSELSLWLALILEIAAGAIAYAGMFVVFHRSRLRRLTRFARSLRG